MKRISANICSSVSVCSENSGEEFEECEEEENLCGINERKVRDGVALVVNVRKTIRMEIIVLQIAL